MHIRLPIQNMAVRIKQSSEDEVRDKYFKINKKIAKLELIIDVADKSLTELLSREYSETLNNIENNKSRHYKDLLSSTICQYNLKTVYDDICAKLYEMTEQESKEIDMMLIGTEEVEV